MDKQEFFNWSEEKAIDFDSIKVHISDGVLDNPGSRNTPVMDTIVYKPGWVGVYRTGRIRYTLYQIDVDGSYDVLETGKEDKIFAMLKSIVENRMAGGLTLQILYDWAVAKGLENLPISVLPEHDGKIDLSMIQSSDGYLIL